jgi:ADP-heptose:LPS heptosyltransferase
MTLIVSKTDALGDQIFASGFIHTLLRQYPEDHVFWLVRRGYEGCSKLFEGSKVFFADQSKSPEDESSRCIEFSELPRRFLGWERVTFVPIPIDAYSAVHLGELVLADLDWWLHFVRGLRAEVAVAGSISLNWLDWAIVCGSGARTTAGCEDGEGRHEIPSELADFVQLVGGQKLRFSYAINFEYSRSELESFALLAKVLTGKLAPREFRIAPESGASRVGKNSILIAPGAGDPQKSYPRSGLLEVVKILRNAKIAAGYGITILEGPKDAETVGQFCQLLNAEQIDHARVLFQSTDLPDLVASLRSSALLVCNDTLYAHLAAFVGTPTVAVWGQGHAGRFLPPSGCITILQIDIQCQGCDWNCIFDERRCITSLEPRHIVEACLERLDLQEAREPLLLRKFPSQTSPDEVREAFRSAIVKNAARDRYTHTTLGSALAERQKWMNHFQTKSDRLGAEVERFEAVVAPQLYAELEYLREYRRGVDKILGPFRKLPGFKRLVEVISSLVIR